MMANWKKMADGLRDFTMKVVTPKVDKLDLTDVSKGLAQQIVNKPKPEPESVMVNGRRTTDPSVVAAVKQSRSRPGTPLARYDWVGDGGLRKDYAAERQAELDRYGKDGTFKSQFQQEPLPYDPSTTKEEAVKASIDNWHEKARKKSRIVSDTHPAFPSSWEDDEEFERRRVEENKARAREAKKKHLKAKEQEARDAEEAEAEAQRQIRELELLEAEAAYAENPRFGQF